MHTHACKILFVIMAAYISRSYTRSCQPESTDNIYLSNKHKTQTQTDTHSVPQVLRSIYCSAACQCAMSIRAENGSFHSISHSNELLQNSPQSHTSTASEQQFNSLRQSVAVKATVSWYGNVLVNFKCCIRSN